MQALHLNRFNKFLTQKLQKRYKNFVIISWVRIDQRVGYEPTESGYETSWHGYETSGYETSTGTKRLDTDGTDRGFSLGESAPLTNGVTD